MQIQSYGLLTALAVTLSAVLFFFTSRRRMLKPDTFAIFAPCAIALGVILARIIYCACILDYIVSTRDFGAVLRLSDGGYAMYGAMLGWLSAAAIAAKLTKQKPSEITDAFVPAFCVFILVIRCGGAFFNQGFGMNFASWFDPDEYDPAYRYSMPFLANSAPFFERFPFAAEKGGVYYWNVWMLEAITALVLLFVFCKRHEWPSGIATTRFIALYSGTQIIFEAMKRGDVLYLPYLGFVRANQVFAAIAILCSALYVIIKITNLNKSQKTRLFTFICLPNLLFGAGIVTAMEFAAFEKKITVLANLPADICHLIMACGAAVMVIGSVLFLTARMHDGYLFSARRSRNSEQ